MTDLATPPDGGWGWVVVFASFMIHVIADGVMYSFGVFYVDLNKHFGSTKAESAWIASIMTSVTFGAGPLVSALVNRYGCRIVCMMGSFVSAMAFAVSTQATNVETMYLTLGLMLGVGLGLMYLPAIVSVTCYFEKQRAFATGIAVCGSGIGTFIMAPLTDILLINYGWKNTMLVLAAILCGCSIFGFLFRSLEPSDKSLPASVVNGVQQLSRKQLKPMVRISEELPTAPPSVPRNLTETNLADRLTEEDSQCSSSENTSTDWNRIATSQPLLAHPPSKSKVFGSHDGIHLFGSSRRPSSTHLEVMRRKDIFYSGSLINIPSYRSNPEVYEQHVVSPVDETAATAMCGCLHCPDNFVATLKNMTGFSLLKHPVFMMFAVSNFLTSIGYIVPYVYIVDKAITSGVDRNSASYLLSIIGISNTVARIVLGYLSDRPDINRLYLYNTALTIAGLGTACNAFCSDFVCLAVYAAVFGFSMGAYVGLTSVILVDLLGLDRLTNAFGLLLLFQGLASLIGPPVTGALYDSTSSYNTGFILAGSVIAASGIMLCFIPCMEGYCSRRWPSTHQSQSISAFPAAPDARLDNRNNTQPA